MTLPLNPLYEVVPVTKETMPPPGRHHVITNDGQKALYHFTGNDISIITMREQYTHWLRPLPPERMEELVIEFAEWISNNQFTMYNNKWTSTKIHYSGRAYSTKEVYKIFTDNLINEISK